VSSRVVSRATGQGRPAAPVRLLHLGLGNFFRAHQAWYTGNAPDAQEWGYGAFAGRSSTLADQLSAQQGLYTLVNRARDADAFAIVSSVSRAHVAADHAAFIEYFGSRDLAAVTLTVTEAGYLRVSSPGWQRVAEPMPDHSRSSPATTSRATAPSLDALSERWLNWSIQRWLGGSLNR
jgi:fructuronate reductase